MDKKQNKSGTLSNVKQGETDSEIATIPRELLEEWLASVIAKHLRDLECLHPAPS